MIFTAILIFVVIGCMFYTAIPNILLILICLSAAILFIAAGKHKHSGLLVIDYISQKSRLNKVNPALKFCSSIILIFICLCSKTIYPGLFLVIVMFIFIVVIGGLKTHEYLSLICIPIAFLFISGLVLLFEYGSDASGMINVPFFNGYLIVDEQSQAKTQLIILRALGSISCLYFLSLTTTVSELINVFRKFKVPEIIIELMYLIYRYIFILFGMHHLMKSSAESRMGFKGYKRSIQTTGKIYMNLFVRSYWQANKTFDAMESRGYKGEIRFLEHKKNLKSLHLIITATVIIATLLLVIILR